MNRAALFALALGFALGGSAAGAEFIESDVCIYGGTSAGIAAAVQTSRMGKSVVLIEPSPFLGGLTTSGLGATDIGNKAAIGGVSREFYQAIAKYYAKDSSWVFESHDDYFSKRNAGRNSALDLKAPNAAWWTFEPHVADQVFDAMLKEAKIPVYLNRRLTLVRKDKARIVEIVTEDTEVFRARMYIDATYEGDLLDKADVSFTVGREGNREYGETLNGIRGQTPKHQFLVRVDPYLTPGDTNSGLLPFIQKGELGKPGDGDAKVQTYNFRLCFTTNESNRLPIEPPEDYDANRYELLARYLEALVAAGKKPVLSDFWNPIWMPNQKTDINNNGAFSTDYIGANHSYPEADFAARGKTFAEHEDYTRGFLTFLATSPRVPENIRSEMKRWGPARDEFTNTHGWPRQLYIREARRMVSDYVMTEANCRGTVKAEDSIGLAAYNMDSHNCQRIVRDGKVENEGDVQVAPMAPYPISYRAIVPKRSEAENLLVPVCLSASHIAYGSIRMEPVFMILGQSAATAAVIAIEDKARVQKVDYAKLKKRLLEDKQALEWPAK